MILVTFDDPGLVDLEAVKAAIEDLLSRRFYLTPGLEATVETAVEGDPLDDGSGVSSTNAMSGGQEWRLKKEMGGLGKLLGQARLLPSVDRAALDIAYDVYFVCSTEYKDHCSKRAEITKKRAHDLIDACIETRQDMEYEIEQAN